MRKLLLPLLVAIALPAMAQEVFSYQDSNGDTVYTNMPPENVVAKPVNIPTTQIVSPQSEQSPVNPVKKAPAPQMQQPSINSVKLVGIPDDASLRANDGDFTVTVQIDSNNAIPSYAYSFQLLLDGNPYGAIQASNSFTLKDINRGTHTIQANVFYRGAIVASSATESFTIQRVSVNTPQPWKIKPR